MTYSIRITNLVVDSPWSFLQVLVSKREEKRGRRLTLYMKTGTKKESNIKDKMALKYTESFIQ